MLFCKRVLTCEYIFSCDRSIWRTIIEKTMYLPHSQIMLFRPSQYLKSSPLYRNVTPPINSAPIVSIAWRGSCPLNSSFGRESFHMYPCCIFFPFFFCLYCNDGFSGTLPEKNWTENPSHTFHEPDLERHKLNIMDICHFPQEHLLLSKFLLMSDKTKTNFH